jgi:hypothetical protein
MKIKTLVAASALAAAGFVGASTQPASAACGVTLTVDNDKPYDVTVHWTYSKVRARPAGVAGSWAKMGTTSVTLDADTSGGGDDIDKGLNLTFGCGVARQYYVYWTGGGNSGYEYQNETGSAGSWTTDITPFIDIE